MTDPFATPTTDKPRILTISDSAVTRLKVMMAAENNVNLMLRISVSGGGCSGFQYGFSFDEKLNDDDMTFEKNGVSVVSDNLSMDLLSGSEVNFVDDLMGQYFQMVNPNAASSCGCGTSFAV